MGIEAIGKLIEYYERHLGGIDGRDPYNTEVPLVLIARDDIEDRWSELTPEQRDNVLRLDDLLLEKHEQVASVLPNHAAEDRRRWWWFLDEGPQVREQAAA